MLTRRVLLLREVQRGANSAKGKRLPVPLRMAVRLEIEPALTLSALLTSLDLTLYLDVMARFAATSADRATLFNALRAGVLYVLAKVSNLSSPLI